MLAFRTAFKVKPGRVNKAREMAPKIKEAVPDWKGRIYVSEYGPGSTVIFFEDTHESVAEREAYWAKRYDTPEFRAFVDEWNAEVAASGGSTEIWHLTEI
jgi:hypothetical protein